MNQQGKDQSVAMNDRTAAILNSLRLGWHKWLELFIMEYKYLFTMNNHNMAADDIAMDQRGKIKEPGPHLSIKTALLRYGVPMLPDCLIFSMVIPILVRRHIYIETASWSSAAMTLT